MAKNRDPVVILGAQISRQVVMKIHLGVQIFLEHP